MYFFAISILTADTYIKIILLENVRINEFLNFNFAALPMDNCFLYNITATMP